MRVTRGVDSTERGFRCGDDRTDALVEVARNRSTRRVRPGFDALFAAGNISRWQKRIWRNARETPGENLGDRECETDQTTKSQMSLTCSSTPLS